MSSRRIAQTGLGAAIVILGLSVAVLFAGAFDSAGQHSSSLSRVEAVTVKPMPFATMAVRTTPTNLSLEKR